MSKSPLNFGFLAGAYSAMRGGRGRKKLSKRINKLENQMSTLMRDRNSNANTSFNDPTAIGPGTNVAGTEAPDTSMDNLGEDINTSGVTEGNFSPNTLEAAQSMFGSTIENSFDKQLTPDTLSDEDIV